MESGKRILMVSMPTLHFFRWANQLKEEGHEVFWFDITDGGNYIPKISWISQITGWKNKFNYPGRFFLKRKLPKLYALIQNSNERNTAKIFEEKLLEINPDVVHSFALYVSCAPIISVMEKYPQKKWIYSSWGSDLFYFKDFPEYLKDIKRVLPRIDYLFTDCKRDLHIAGQLGFKGEFLGEFPGGGGFDFNLMSALKRPIEQRNVILIKGFQGRSGRAIQVLKSLKVIKDILSPFQIQVFGADDSVFQCAEEEGLINWGNLTVLGRVPHEEVLKMMGESAIYIGNSNSDGMPNTLLEAFCMDVFPIQSNPGGVTEEIITHGKNGYLIQDCENIEEITGVIREVISNYSTLVENSLNINRSISSQLEYNVIKNKVVKIYESILN